MRIVINTDIIQAENETTNSFNARRLKDVNSDYILESNEVFSEDLMDVRIAHQLFPSDIDYKRYRAGMQYFGNVADEVWDSYTDDWKFAICKEKATTLERIKIFLNDDNEMDFIMKVFDRLSTECRRNRYSLAKAALLNNVTEIIGFGINADIIQFGLDENYIKNGLEGLESNDPVLGLYDFLNSTDLPGNDGLGTPLNTFASIGIATRSLVFRSDSTLNQASLVALINDYLKHGKKIS